MATRVVLYHRSQERQVGGASCLSLGSPTTASVMGQQRIRLGFPKDVPLLQGRIRDLLKGDLNLVKVTQVMLIRRTLPGKRRSLRLWEFNPEGPRALQHFMGAMPMEMYKMFFGSQAMCLDLTEDAGLSCNRPDTQVSNLVPGLSIRKIVINSPLKELSF